MRLARRVKERHSPDTVSRSFTKSPLGGMVSGMSTITAILEADADGTLHLPLPEGLR